MEEKGKETYEKIKGMIEEFLVDSNLFYTYGNKAAGVRARRALDEISKLKVIWRKETYVRKERG